MKKNLSLIVAILLASTLSFHCGEKEGDANSELSAKGTGQNMLMGKWYNELCSTMNVTGGTNTTFTGQYSNGASGWCAQPNDWYSLNGNIIAPQAGIPDVEFTVNWNDGPIKCNSTTVWKGYYNVGSIKTDWTLTYNDGSKPPIKGKDTFTRECPTSCASGCP